MLPIPYVVGSPTTGRARGGLLPSSSGTKTKLSLGKFIFPLLFTFISNL
jgi:hypothetical protein